VSWKLACWKPHFTYSCDLIYVHTVHVNCLIWVKFGVRVLNIMLLSIFEFHKYWLTEGHTFLVGIHNITFTHISIAFSATLCTPTTPPAFLSPGWGIGAFYNYCYYCNSTDCYGQVTATLHSKNITLLLLPHQKRPFWEYDGSGSGIMIDLVGKVTLWRTMRVI